MKTETKFNIGETAFLIFSNQIKTCTISEIYTKSTESEKTEITYQVIDLRGDNCGNGQANVDEKRLFKSKEELIKTL